ncbi:MAG: hypothetical protein KDC34_19030 [Saprospiraceae bacterium]|nr:hypothetical protein [Saprospiraceae bacterium]
MTTPTLKIWPQVWEVLKQQGISFILLFGMTYFLWIELQEVKAENKACNSKVVETLVELVIENQRVIDRNTAAFSAMGSKLD